MPLSKKDKQIESISCPVCGKLRSMKTGSMTSWIFRSSSCKCDLSSPSDPVQQKQTNDRDSIVLKDLSLTPSLIAAGSSAEQISKVGTYHFIEMLGQGGMGSVYKVRDTSNDQLYALKILRREFANDQNAVKRFELEAKAAQRLPHPHLGQIFEDGFTEDGQPYLLMEYVEGENLESILRRDGKIDAKNALEIFVQISDAVGFAHQRRIVHRDLKPSNIILTATKTEKSFVKVVDFGIAKVLCKPETNTEILTQSGDVFGTPLYMSPEQCRGAQLDARSDIYSLGCLMYETLTGRPPFTGDSAVMIFVGHLQEKPSPLLKTNKTLSIPSGLNWVVMHCLEKDPDRRYQSMDELTKDLESILAEETPMNVRKPQLMAAAKLLLAGVLTFAVWIAVEAQLRLQASQTKSVLVSEQKVRTDLQLPEITKVPTQNLPALSVSEIQRRTKETDRLEQFFKTHPGYYDRGLRNELRHLYGENELKLMEQNDIILQHDIQDPYTMHCLVWWKDEKDPYQAIHYLEDAIAKYPHFKYLQAASLLKIGEIYYKRNNFHESTIFFNRVANDNDPALQPYAELAKKYLLQPRR